MAESIYNSEEYLVAPLSTDYNCDLNCMSCDNCECEDQGGEADCSATCQCSIEGCQYCDTCQTSCQKTCQCSTQRCQTSCEKACQCSIEGCETCQDACQKSCECSLEGCQSTCQKSCECTVEGCETCQSTCQKNCQCSVEGCETCQATCEKSCQNDQCLECQASCQICNSKQSHCAKNKQGLTQHIGSMSVPTVGQKVRTKDYTDIATYLNKAIAAGRWSLSPLATEVKAGTPINRSTLDTFISYVRTISGSYLDKKDSKISVSDITTLKGYLDGANIPDNVPCCENTGYEGCVTEQCAASKCQDNYQ